MGALHDYAEEKERENPETERPYFRPPAAANPQAGRVVYSSPSAQAMVDAARGANEQWPDGIELQTKSGTKRIRVRRCTRMLRLSNDLMVQCQLEQHNADTHPDHSHRLTVFTPDGNARRVVIHWSELGPVTPLILTKVIKQ